MKFVLKQYTKAAPVRQTRSWGFGMAGTACLALMLGLALASGATTTTFEGFTTGESVNNQGDGGTTLSPQGNLIPDPYGSLWTVADEWGFTGPFDEEVVDDGTGNIVWRFSNAVTTGGFSNQPNSPSSPLVAGETGAFLYNDRGPDHTQPLDPPGPRAGATTKYFRGGFEFRSATGSAQSGLSLSVSPVPRQSNFRMSFVGISDQGTGFDLTFFDTGVNGAFDGTQIASSLSYADWHKLDIFIEFVDGINGDGTGNDIVTVLLNDAVIHVGTSWETFQAAQFPFSSPLAVDALLFRAAGGAVSDNLDNGLYFDNVIVDNAQLLTPTVLSCLGFEPPMDRPVVVKRPNRVLPLRMTLVDADGNVVTSLADPPVVNVDYEGAHPYEDGDLDELNSAGQSDDGNQFVFDGNFWKFNLSTRGLAAGTYTITAVSGSEADYVILPACVAEVGIE